MRRVSAIAVSLAVVSTTGLLPRPVSADNPIIQTKYTADPAPMVYDGKVFLYTSHDEDTAVNFIMYDWLLYTTTDMANWTDHGVVAGVKAPANTFPWAGGANAWAPQVVPRNGKFYMYVPIQAAGRMTLAVAVADSPYGPFKDPIGKALASTGTTDDIDPTVFIDDDGQAYLFWGNPSTYYVKLNEDMISTAGSITKLPKIQTYQEGPWFYRRENNYYLAFASTCCPEGIGYAMATSATGPWTYKGSIMDGDAQSSGNHPGIIDYKGSSYVFGFNYNVQLQREGKRIGERRSICVEKMTYKSDGTIPKLPFWSKTGPDPIESLNPYLQTEAETMAWAWDVKTEPCSEGGIDVTAIENGDYIKVRGVDFAAGATSLDVRVASAGSGGNIEARLDSQTGKLLGTCAVTGTGGAQTWATKTCAITGASGVHDLFFVFTGGAGRLFNFNWWKFSGSGTAVDGGLGTDGGSARDAGGTGGAVAGSGGRGADGGAGASGAGGRTGGQTGSGGASIADAGAGGSGGMGGSRTGSGGDHPAGSGGRAGGEGGAGQGSGGRGAPAGGASAGGATASGGSGSSTARGGAAGTTDEPAPSGCSCEMGRPPRRGEGLLALALCLGALGLCGSRRRRPC